MANEKNLRRLTSEQAREIGSKGGKASAESKKQKKTMQEMAQYILTCPLNAQGIARMKRAGCNVEENNPTMLTAMIVGQINSAINGNQKSAEFIKDLIDNKAEQGASAQSFIEALNDKAIEVDDGTVEE